MSRAARWAGTSLVAAVLTASTLSVGSEGMPADLASRQVSPLAVPLAVLGDSNSHSYQDRVAFPAGSNERGGRFRARTFNWNEVLARLRPGQVDNGPWQEWGRSGLLADGGDALGRDIGRAPRKEDYLYNFAHSGATCNDLMTGSSRQASRLVALMDREPARWQRGVVVIRIGLNDWSPWLDLQAKTPDAPQLTAATQGCLDALRAATSLIRASHPRTKILIVGIASEADGPVMQNRWVSAGERQNLRKATNAFNGAVRGLAESVPNAAFFDDDAWTVQRWGVRGSAPVPAFKTVKIGRAFTVNYSNGDEPNHALLADDHAGLVFNALWAQSLVARLREAFQLPIAPISDDEVARFVLPLVAEPPR